MEYLISELVCGDWLHISHLIHIYIYTHVYSWGTSYYTLDASGMHILLSKWFYSCLSMGQVGLVQSLGDMGYSVSRMTLQVAQGVPSQDYSTLGYDHVGLHLKSRGCA